LFLRLIITAEPVQRQATEFNIAIFWESFGETWNFLRFFGPLRLSHPAHTQLVLLSFLVPRNQWFLRFCFSLAVKTTFGLGGTERPVLKLGTFLVEPDVMLCSAK